MNKATNTAMNTAKDTAKDTLGNNVRATDLQSFEP
jgi:hypothetical protein